MGEGAAHLVVVAAQHLQQPDARLPCVVRYLAVGALRLQLCAMIITRHTEPNHNTAESYSNLSTTGAFTDNP